MYQPYMESATALSDRANVVTLFLASKISLFDVLPLILFVMTFNHILVRK